MSDRDLHNSLSQLQSDLQASMPKEAGQILDNIELGMIKALLEEVATSHPEHPVVKAMRAEPIESLRVREALVVVGQLLSAVPTPGPSIA